jgi:hypothetical protein
MVPTRRKTTRPPTWAAEVSRETTKLEPGLREEVAMALEVVWRAATAAVKTQHAVREVREEGEASLAKPPVREEACRETPIGLVHDTE